MKIIVTIFIIFLIQYAYLDTTNTIDGLVTTTPEKQSCLIDHSSISIILYTSEIPEGKNIGEQEFCNVFDNGTEIIIITHGFVSSANGTQFHELSMLLAKDNYIVLGVDWSNAACTNGLPIVKYVEYPIAVKNTRIISKQMASYIKLMIEKCGVSIKKITLIGHSLGAHVSGFTAKYLQKWDYGKIGYIIGADPANPLFEFNDCSNRLCKSDADRVNVIHTSILGIPDAIGNTDLYFNGGKLQPGCIVLDVACSHTMSVQYMIEILKNNCGFPGVPISSSILPLFPRKPVYPDSTTTNCIIVNNTIFENGNMIEGKFNVMVNSKLPYCTKKSFNCQL